MIYCVNRAIGQSDNIHIGVIFWFFSSVGCTVM